MLLPSVGWHLCCDERGRKGLLLKDKEIFSVCCLCVEKSVTYSQYIFFPGYEVYHRMSFDCAFVCA